ncbi:hypothetical protein B0H14DRAFT_2640323 [Mycena olivaceomarginata]|nr:hypothetical protein B0H14DRAFT_2640323 [Mycena olivaceomarginata]
MFGYVRVILRLGKNKIESSTEEGLSKKGDGNGGVVGSSGYCTLGCKAEGRELTAGLSVQFVGEAVTIGFNYGEENLARVREEGFCEGKIAGFTEGVESEHSKTVLESTEAAALHEKALEAERVWGYDIGWKLCSELQGGAQEAGTVSSATPPRSLRTLSQSRRSIGPRTRGFFPYFPPPVHHSSPPSLPRDFSVLSTGAQKPFASLQRRRRRPPSHAYHIPATFITPYCYPTTALACIFSNPTALATFMAHPACHIQFFFVNTVWTTSRAARLGSRSPPS